MRDTLFDMSQYQSEATQSYSTDWRDATGTDAAWDEPDLKQNLETSTKELSGNLPTGWRSNDDY